MSSVFFRNKVGTTEQLAATPGQPLTDVLRLHGIPRNAILTWRNGEVVSEDTTVIEPGDLIEVRQVRHYDLDVTRRPRRQVYGEPNPIYTKSVLFDNDGSLEVRSEQLDADRFVNYVEETFVQSIVGKQVVRPDDSIVIGLSGGRDSVSYLTLMERTRDRLPQAREVRVHVRDEQGRRVLGLTVAMMIERLLAE